MLDRIAPDVTVRRLTGGAGEYFFGYYDKTPWDPSGRVLLAMRAQIRGRQPQPDDVLTVGTIDLDGAGVFEPQGQTQAWCWQQGTMLQWVGTQGRRLLYNERRKGAFAAVIRDLATDADRTLDRPIYALSRDGAQGVSVNFARLNDVRPGYGYAGVADPGRDQLAPADDGVFTVDLSTGTSELIVSLAELAAYRPSADMANTKHWVNHLTFNPAGTRIAFLHRWHPPDTRSRQTRLFTVGLDGADLRMIWDARHVSHYDWRSEHEILVWGTDPELGAHFFVIDDRTRYRRVVGAASLTEDGHCSYRPTGDWFVNDTYPDAQRLRTLMLVREADGLRVDLGRFYAPADLDGPTRCDLHPRWNRDGTQICFDSVHEGSRHMYMLDVRDPLARAS